VLAYAAIFDAQHDSYAAAQRCLAAEQVRVERLCCCLCAVVLII
jgi:hypothetical protein